MKHIVVVLLAFAASHGVPAAQSSWEKMYTSTYADLHSVASGLNRFVTVGEKGITIVSNGLNLNNWSTRKVLTETALRCVAYSGSLFVAVGDDGVIRTSVDGVSWTPRPSVDILRLNGVTWAGNRFYAVGAKGTLIFSADGITWTKGSTGSTVDLNSIAWGIHSFGGPRFLAVGAGGTILASADAVTWTAHRHMRANWNRVAWIDSAFYVVGDSTYIIRTLTGHEATGIWPPSPVRNMYGLAKVADGVVMVGEKGTLYHYTGRIGGNTLRVVNENYTLLSVAYTGQEMVVTAGNGGVFTSTDGVIWTTVNSRVGSHLPSVIWSGEKLVTVGLGGEVLTSGNGSRWTRQLWNEGWHLNAVTSAGSQFVAVGTGGTIFTSPDGKMWTQRESCTDRTLRAVVYANPMVAVGDSGAMCVSNNGRLWSARWPGTDRDLLGAAFTNPGFLAVGRGGAIVRAPDGETWAAESSGTTRDLNAVMVVEGELAAVGDSGEILVSADGETWERKPPPTHRKLNGLAGNANSWVAVGDSGLILYSHDDGDSWNEAEDDADSALNSVLYLNGEFLAVGDRCSIFGAEEDLPVPTASYQKPGNRTSALSVHLPGMVPTAGLGATHTLDGRKIPVAGLGGRPAGVFVNGRPSDSGERLSK